MLELLVIRALSSAVAILAVVVTSVVPLEWITVEPAAIKSVEARAAEILGPVPLAGLDPKLATFTAITVV